MIRTKIEIILNVLINRNINIHIHKRHTRTLPTHKLTNIIKHSDLNITNNIRDFMILLVVRPKEWIDR